ncbi:MAG: glycosyltransferase family 2 protein [Peptococcaceae bacterium]
MEELIVFFRFLIIFVSGYYFFLSLFCLGQRKELYRHIPPTMRFALVIAAHNEEKVIKPLLESLFNQDYPKGLYHIFVVADNCRDQTAQVARGTGAVVFSRHDQKKRGKGYALEFGFQKIFALKENFDALIIFDADNLVDPNFLRVMNYHLLKGEKIIQGYLGVKNPGDSWVTRAIAVGYYISNRFWQLAKYNVGLSCALGGTGMCIAVEVLKEVGWQMDTLTEDLEFQTKALLLNRRVTWAHQAVVYDEKPLTIRQSMHQRLRWMQGHCDVAGRYFFKLLYRGIRGHNLRQLDGALHLIQPFFTVFFGFTFLYCLMTVFTNFSANPRLFLYGLLFQYFYLALPLILEKASLTVYGWLFYYPLFTLTWIPVTLAGFIYRKRKIWYHTPHVRDIPLAGIKKKNEKNGAKP